ncbi:hypothetical protein CCP3SC1_120035 [Gammaproteobacteria bacterium]
MKSRGRPQRVIIQGITQQGRPFRSNDWAEKLQGCMASSGYQSPEQLQGGTSDSKTQRRGSFSPHLQIGFRNGVKSLIVDRELWETNPLGYEFLIGFARDNDLNVIMEPAEEQIETPQQINFLRRPE